jgi:hypothetical protein
VKPGPNKKLTSSLKQRYFCRNISRYLNALSVEKSSNWTRSCGKTSLMASMNSFMNSSIYRRKTWINETRQCMMIIRTSAVSGLFRRIPRYRGSLRNFSVFVPKSRQIGKVVVGLIPAPATYKSLSFGTQLKKKKEGYRKNILVTVFQWIWEVHWHQGPQDRGYESLELFLFC